jgi:DNA-binding SARP family transcriptional activator
MLGRFEVRIGEQIVIDGGWGRRKALALLKLLALQKDRSIHRECVLEMLWPELTPLAAGNNLRKKLHYLRGRLDGHAAANSLVDREGEMLVLSPDVTIDVDEFELAAAKACSQRDDPALYHQALDLYRTDLLPEDAYVPWTESRREELRSLHIRLLWEVTRLHEDRGEADAAIRCLTKLAEIEPLDEEAHRSLMRQHTEIGRRDLALRQYDRCREALKAELGVPPAEATVDLHHEISVGRLSPPTSSLCPDARLLEACPDVVFRLLLRPEVRVEYVNPAAEQILGHPLAVIRSGGIVHRLQPPNRGHGQTRISVSFRVVRWLIAP